MELDGQAPIDAIAARPVQAIQAAIDLDLEFGRLPHLDDGGSDDRPEDPARSREEDEAALASVNGDDGVIDAPLFTASPVLGPDGEPLDAESEAYGRIKLTFRAVTDEMLKRFALDPELMRQMHWRDFEELVAELFARDGFDVTLTPGSGDKGVDLFAARRVGFGSMLYVVECKRRSAPIGPDFVRELAWVIDRHRATGGVLATTSRFTAGAREEHRSVKFRMALAEFDDLRRWLLGGPIF